MPNGTTYTDRGHLAGNTTIASKPDGTAVMHGKFNQPWQDAMQLLGAVAVAKSGENVAEAAIYSSKAKSLAATRAGVTRARDAAKLKELELAFELERFKILHPATLPVTP